jgi:hypothetical protein
MAAALAARGLSPGIAGMSPLGLRQPSTTITPYMPLQSPAHAAAAAQAYVLYICCCQ